MHNRPVRPVTEERARAAEQQSAPWQLIQRHFLNEHRLRENVQRIGLHADRAMDQFIRIPVDMGRLRIPEPVRQPCYQLLFLFGHFGSLSVCCYRRRGPIRSVGSI